MKRHVLSCAIVFALPVCVPALVHARGAVQVTAGDGQAVSAMATAAEPGFLVATIRPAAPDANGWSFESEGSRIQCRNATLLDMLMLAYQVHSKQIVNAPDWVSHARFDVSGVPDEPGVPSLPQVRSMYRKLLAERFGLVLHPETRSIPVFSITTAAGGAKLKVADPQGSPNTGSRSTASQRVLLFRNMSMADLALNLNFYEDRPVINDTALAGKYDFTLSWSPDVAANSDNDSAPPLVTALKDQLGLALTAVKEPAPVLVVDHVEQPSPN